MTVNSQVIFKSHPEGMPVPENFEVVQVDLPPLEEGQFLLENAYLSLDPYMRMLKGANVGKQLVKLV